MTTVNETNHIMISIYAEAVAKQAMLAHYLEGTSRKFHHDEMIEQLSHLIAELRRNDLMLIPVEVEAV